MRPFAILDQSCTASSLNLVTFRLSMIYLRLHQNTQFLVSGRNRVQAIEGK